MTNIKILKDKIINIILNRYNQIVQVYFSDFNYSVVKRGATNHDLWNISVTLEEV
jgi:hypothetical protein